MFVEQKKQKNEKKNGTKPRTEWVLEYLKYS